MKIAILLPYKENFSKNFAGAVSIFVNNTYKLSKYKKDILIYGSTDNKPLSLNYKNILFEKKFLQSSSRNYLNYFLQDIKNTQIEILEIHNRPHYVDYVDKNYKFKKILYFHNDPLEMQGSILNEERINLINKCDYIVFNSNWTKNRFLDGIETIVNNDKITVIPQSTSKVKINFKKKKNLITFIGKLNDSKGYDIFGKAIIKILNKYKNWKSLVIGDEPRQKLFFNHERLSVLGFKNNAYVLDKLKEVSISVIPSKWNEPFGRASLEASSRGCAIIRSDTGGLKETASNTLIIKKFTSNEVFKKIELLIKNSTLRAKLQKETYKNFYLTNKFSSKKIDHLRTKIFKKNIFTITSKKNNLKILHITNFNERFDGRLHYNTGKRINNGLIRLGHNVLTISDRDIISSNRSLLDPKSYKILNDKIINNFNNFNPDLLVIGHADSVSAETIDFLKVKKNDLKIFQWFLDPVSSKGPDYSTNKKRLLEKSKIIDASFVTTDPNSLDFKVKNSFFIPNPADKSFEILENYKHDCFHDLFFAMSHGVHRGKLKKGKHDNRENFLKKLKTDRNISFNLFGVDNSQPIWGQNFLNELSKCKMGLNLSRGLPVKYYSSDRIAQLMGNGLLTFIDEKVRYSDFFNKNEIVTYKNANDLLEKIHKFKRDDKKRKKIAKLGRDKYLKYFNSTTIANYMVDKTMGIKSKKKFLWTS
ncbi:glycosyltransferase [Candidatus Pelagibacter sp.]|nr:glycosyltransferase [Candidatus Pelagibacter sp.]